MPVPSSLASLSTTPASNSPGGGENPFPELDDHIRAGYAFDAQNRDAIAVLSSAKQDKTGTFPYAQLTGIPAPQSRYSPGEWVLSCSITAPTGTLTPNGQTIGSASSGATSRANADTSDLFAMLWNATSNTDLPIQDSAGAASTRGASAAADFAANKRLPLPNIQDGDALVAAVSSAVLSRTAGQVINHTHPAVVADPGHAHTINADVTNGGNASTYQILNGVSVFRNVSTQTSTTGISVSISDPAGGGTKNKAAGLMTRVYIAL